MSVYIASIAQLHSSTDHHHFHLPKALLAGQAVSTSGRANHQDLHFTSLETFLPELDTSYDSRILCCHSG